MFKKDQLNQLALPLILSNVVSLVISLCDQAVMGHLSITSFATVGIVAGFINSVTGVLGANVNNLRKMISTKHNHAIYLN